MRDLKVVFETGGSKDFANAVVQREVDDTDLSHRNRTRLFQIACEMGLLDSPEKD